MSGILDEKLSSRASRIRLSAVSLAENMRAGNFRSMSRGQGMEFSDVRDYLPGDNVRAIDWNVTARMARPFIKQYEEDRELNVFFVLDCSLSMLSGSGGKSKLSLASEVAALLVLASDLNSGANGAAIFDGEIKFSCPPRPGRENSMMIVSKIGSAEDGALGEIKRGSAISRAIHGTLSLLKRRSLVFLISDFRAEGYQSEFSLLAQKNDVVAIRITDPADSSLPNVGTVSFRDPETGDFQVLPTNSRSFSRAWLEANRSRVDSWESFCAHRGAFPIKISTAQDPVFVLNKFFLSRRKM